MTFQELFALFGMVAGPLVWWPVGRASGWWAGAGAALLATPAGFLLGWSWAEALENWGCRSRRRDGAVLLAASLAHGAFLGFSLWWYWSR